jgi:hypothetical protein
MKNNQQQQNTMTRIIIFFFLSIISAGSYGQTISENELDILTGGKWTGELSYQYYNDNTVEIMPVELMVNKIKPGVYEFVYTYPDEPKANTKTKLKIKKDGTKIGGIRIVKVEKKPDGSVIVNADGKGSDNKESAWFYLTYYLSPNKFTTKKEVEYKGDKERFVRNEYHFSR